jgi:hypothetical protein
MGTFLATDKMNPALRARVERAVSHRVRAKHHAAELGLDRPFASGERIRFARLFPVLVALILGVASVVVVTLDKRAVERERAALLGAVSAHRAEMPKGYDGFLATVDRWIADGASDLPDTIDPSLRAPGALDALLQRPAVYLRGPEADLRNPAKIDDAAKASTKDAFLVCLLHPPPSSSEKDRLAKVRGVYFDGAKVDEETANVRRLADARAGLTLLGPSFETNARAAKERVVLAKLKREIDTTPFDRTKRAAVAEVLLLVTDIPHGDARVALVDIVKGKVLYRAKRRIEEQGTSAMASLHRADLEGCSLAMGVRKAVSE